MTPKLLLSLSAARIHRWRPWLALATILALALAARAGSPPATAVAAGQAIAGRVLDAQEEPVADAEVRLYLSQTAGEPVHQTRTQADGSYILLVPPMAVIEQAYITIERPHFTSVTITLTEAELLQLRQNGSLALDDVILQRRLGLSFWLATVIFVAMLALIATERLHKTLIALIAIATILTISLVGSRLSPEFFIFDFGQALEHVDFDVIFLLMGMMIVIGVVEETGIFQWLAYRAYRLARGRAWLLVMILMAITAVATAVLDNVTTMLLISPITIEIALVLGINPLSLLLPALMASNVGGLSTLIGTPVNIMIGSYVGLSFNDFLVNLTPGVLLAEAGLFVFVLLRYRREYHRSGPQISPALLKRLEQTSQIKDPVKLRKAGIVLFFLLALFIFGDWLHLPPAVAAIIGAVVMLLWVHPDIEQMMGVVDWTTLIFFIGLFMVIGAISEVGLISVIAQFLGNMVSGRPVLALLVVVWVSALLSGLIDNIPFAAAMLPVIAFLTKTVPGAESNVLYYGLAVGADMGGNSTLIASSANLVMAGIAEQAGYPVSFKKFMQVGLPATLITTALGCLWLFIRF